MRSFPSSCAPPRTNERINWKEGDQVKKEKGSTFTIAYPEAKELTFTFPEGTTITKTDYVTFTVFAVPETIEGLTLVFHLGEEGSEIQTATLKKDVGGGEKQDISFAGCKKHYLRGIAVKGGWTFKYLTLDIDVMDWVDLETTISSGEGVQATQFNIKGADNLRELKDAAVDADSSLSPTQKEEAKEANKAYRQWWVFPAGNTVTVTYKIMMPLEGTWEVEPLGDTDAFTVTSSTGALSGNLAGATASATYITLTITSNATDKKSLYHNDIALLADLLGHKNISTTRMYLRKSSLEQRNLINQIVNW